MKKIQFILLPLVIIFSSCAQSGIFYTLENEKKIEESNNLNNSISFENMVMTNDFYLGNGYISIRYRNKSDADSTIDNWHSLALPSGSADTPSGTFASDATVSSMVLVGNDLIISRISYDGSSIVSGIYRLAGASTLDLTTVTSASWEMLVKTISSNSSNSVVEFYKLFTGNGLLYVNQLSYKYNSVDKSIDTLSDSQLFVVTGTLTPAAINNNLVAVNPNVDEIVLDPYFQAVDIPAKVDKIHYGTTNFWMILNANISGTNSDNKVLKSADSIFSSPVDITSGFGTLPAPAATKYIDIYELNATQILLSTSRGSLYITNDGGTNFIELPKTSAVLQGFLDISAIMADHIMIGSAADSTDDGTGYYLLNTTDPNAENWVWNTTSNISNKSNYSSSLSDTSISGFLLDHDLPTRSRIFTYTYSEGVWMINDLTPPLSENRYWTRE